VRRSHADGPRRRTRGIALVVAVAGTALVATLAVGVSRWVLAGTRLAASTADALQAEALVRSGITMAAVLLEERAATREADGPAGVLGDEPLRQPLGGGTIEVRIEDATRRLDLGAPELAPALRRLITALGLEPGLADTLADWIDTDDVPRPYGAERQWYLGRQPPLVPANAPLGAVSQLALVRGWSDTAIARVRPFVATSGERAVNPNTASPAVLAAWLGSESAADALLARRERGWVPCTGLPACATRTRFYLVHVEARVHDTVRTVSATVWVPPSGPADVRSVVPSAAEEGGEPEALA
jgi:general secretion pathway protein K